jgi:hypothetical protein
MKTDLDSLRYFVYRWLDKARDVAATTDSPFIDKFVFTYISFNALYTAAANALDGAAATLSTWDFRHGGPPKRRFKKYPTEEKRATLLVLEVIGRRKSAACFISCQEAVEALCKCFDTGGLYLYELETGAPDTARDNELITLVRSGDIVSLLKVVYLLRCNLVHGAKALSSVQDKPLTAATVILQAFIPPLLEGVEDAVRSANARSSLSID